MKNLKLKQRIVQLTLMALFSLMQVTFTNAQECLNLNGSFEDMIGNCASTTNCFPDAFNDFCVTNWLAANGGPDLCSLYAPLNVSPPPGGGDRMAVMGVSNGGSMNSCRNQAIYTAVDLVGGTTYELTFYHRTASTQLMVPFEVKIYQTHDIGNAQNSEENSPCGFLNIPTDSEVVFSNDNFISDEWIMETICFTATVDSPNSGLLFVPEKHDQGTLSDQKWLLDMVCLTEFEPCEATTDLTACPEEGSYGFIAYDCPSDYEWEFPAGSTALEFTCDDHSVVLQASPGIYNVTITNEDDCVAVESWEVTEECCTPKCETPTGLGCDYGSNKFVSLFWDPVPGALGYEVCLERRSNDCVCKNTGEPDPIETFTTTNPSINIMLEFQDCFSWKVKTICAEGVISEPSELMCFNYKLQDGCFMSRPDGPKKRLSIDDKGTIAPQSVRIFPNPTEKEVNIQLNMETESPVQLQIFDLQGKMVASKQYASQKGQISLQWNPAANVSSGSYYLKITTNDWTTTERVVYIKK